MIDKQPEQSLLCYLLFYVDLVISLAAIQAVCIPEVCSEVSLSSSENQPCRFSM